MLVESRDADHQERQVRQRLLERLHAQIEAEIVRGEQSPDNVSVADQRRAFAARLVEHVRPLRRFVRRELGRWVALGAVPPDALSEDELVDTVFVRALQHAHEAPRQGLFRWLRRLARRVIRTSIDAERRRIEHERSLEEPVATLGDDWPDQVVRLIDILADPHAELPEDLLLTQETQALLEQALDRLPELWREVFLMRTVDGWNEDMVAEAEGIPVEQVRSIVEISRAFLAEALREMQFSEAG
uniref:Sigma-70 family RNA polymerase sigma factor n=2 Tax=Thermorudis TaxID=1649508 RepID=A0A831T8G9_9BACT